MSAHGSVGSVCLIYENAEDRIQHLIQLIQSHLANGDRCVCVLDSLSDSQAITNPADSILGSEEARERGALVFTSLSDLIGSGILNSTALIDAVHSQADEARKLGFSALLFAMDMESLAPAVHNADEIRRILATNVDNVTLVVLYDRYRSSEELLRAALQSSPFLIIDSDLVENPYCLAADAEVEHKVPDLGLDTMFARIRSLVRENSAAKNIVVQTQDNGRETPAEATSPLFVESSTAALLKVDADGTIVELNAIAEILWSQDRENPVGRNIWDIFPEAIGGHTYQQVQRTVRENKIAQFETFSTILHRWVEVTLVPNADQLWISVRDISKRKEMEETLNARVRQQAAVAELGKQALVATDMQSFMDNLVLTISQTLNVEFVKILRLLPDRPAFRLVAGVGWEPALIDSGIVDGGLDSQAGYTLEAGRPVIVENLAHETRFSGPPLLRDHGIVSGLSVPIARSDGPYGVLGVYTRVGTHFTQDDVNFVQSVANILSTAIDHEKADELERHYAAIVSSSDDAIIGETLEGLISSWNASAEHIFGYSAAEVLGKPVTILYPPELRHEMYELLNDIQHGRRVEQHESVRRTKDGRLIDVSVSLSPIRDRAGRVIGASKTLRDISDRKQADMERLAVNNRLQLALEAGRMGTWDWNMGSNEVVWSTNMERIHGLDPGTFGGSFDEFKLSIHPDDRDRVLSTIQRTLAGAEDYHVEYRNIRPDGSSQWLEARGRVVPGGRGRSNHLTGVCTDVTEQVESRQKIARFANAAVAERDRLQQVIDVIPEGIAIADVDGRIVMSNQAAREIWGQPAPRGDLREYDVFGAEQSDGTPIPSQDLPTSRSVLHGERVVGEQLSVRNETTGEMIPLLVNSAPIRDDEGHISGAVTTFQDISAFKEFERQKDEFLQTLSHDLKNPLTSVKGNAQFLRRRVKSTNADVMPIVDRIENSAVQAVQLIDELLDLTRLQMGRPVELIRGRTDLVHLVKQLADQQAATSRFHFIRVEASEEHLIGYMDEMRVARILSNLLNNAIKYSPDDSEIVIRVERSAAQPSWAEIHVQDHGIGIPPADIPQLFERFRRGSNVEGLFRGSGLGLASCKQIVEQHGGWIDVESEEGVGSTFTVHLPLEDLLVRTTGG